MYSSKHSHKGNHMNKSYLTVILTLTCLLGMGASACAQDTEGVVAKVPFEFVAGARTLPAGTYTIGRLSQDAHLGLIIRSNDNSEFLLPVVVDEACAEKGTLSFQHVGDKYFLTQVDTPAGVYAFSIPRAMTILAQVKVQGTLSSAGSN
jgi:hypothetical protein